MKCNRISIWIACTHRIDVLLPHYVIRKQTKILPQYPYYYVNGSDLSGIENEHTPASCVRVFQCKDNTNLEMLVFFSISTSIDVQSLGRSNEIHLDPGAYLSHSRHCGSAHISEFIGNLRRVWSGHSDRRQHITIKIKSSEIMVTWLHALFPSFFAVVLSFLLASRKFHSFDCTRDIDSNWFRCDKIKSWWKRILKKKDRRYRIFIRLRALPIIRYRWRNIESVHILYTKEVLREAGDSTTNSGFWTFSHNITYTGFTMHYCE